MPLCHNVSHTNTANLHQELPGHGPLRNECIFCGDYRIKAPGLRRLVRIAKTLLWVMHGLMLADGNETLCDDDDKLPPLPAPVLYVGSGFVLDGAAAKLVDLDNQCARLAEAAESGLLEPDPNDSNPWFVVIARRRDLQRATVEALADGKSWYE